MRQFQIYTPWASRLFLVVLAVLAVWSGWEKSGVGMLVTFTLLVFHIDRLLNSALIVTPDELLVKRSRVRPPLTIPLSRVLKVERVEGRARYRLDSCRLVLTYATDDTHSRTREVYLNPQKPDEFVEYLRKKKLGIPSEL